MKITNGIIREFRIGFDRDIFLSAWVFIEHQDGGHQGFGGYVLGGTKDCRAGNHAEQGNLAAEWLVGVMLAADVEDYTKIVGRAIRVKRDSDNFNANIVGIGHILKDDRWFEPKAAFAKLVKDDTEQVAETT